MLRRMFLALLACSILVADGSDDLPPLWLRPENGSVVIARALVTAAEDRGIRTAVSNKPTERKMISNSSHLW